jgi:hypothetical protein
MLNLEKIDIHSLESILAKVQKTHLFFSTLREIAEKNKQSKIPTFLSKEETASILGISCGHLAVLRHRKSGPNFSKIGGAIYYDITDLLDYIDSCKALPETSNSTSKA